MNALGWTIIGSVAGVVAVVISIFQFAQGRRKTSATPSTGDALVTPDSSVAGNTTVETASRNMPTVVGEIPQKPTGFQPREELLAALNASSDHHIPLVHAITGMRGVGKSHLAASFARAKLDEGWRLIAWVNAEDASGILGGLTSVAAALQLGKRNSADVGQTVRNWLEADGTHCLLVFDNATDPDKLLPLIPAAGHSRVLITSTKEAMVNLGIDVPVDVFSDNEALAFLTNRTGRTDVEGSSLLAAELGRLPLALAQAAAVISAQHLDYATYIDRLRSMPVEELLTRTEGSQYPNGLPAAILLSLAGVTTNDQTGICGAILNLISVLSSAGVSRRLILAASTVGPLVNARQSIEVSPSKVDEALGQLSGSSLITFSVDDDSVSAHRLVMRVVREFELREDRLQKTCCLAAELLARETGSLMGSVWNNRVQARELVDQVTGLYEHSLPIRINDPELTSELLRLRGLALLLLNELGDSAQQAITLGEPLIIECQKLLANDHPDTLHVWNNLANAYHAAGRLTDAIKLHRRALAKRERVLGKDSPDTLRSRNNLANAYRTAGQTFEAISLLEQTLADRERILGNDHPDTLRSRNNLANSYREAGRLDEAIRLHERTLTDRERVFGGDHPDTLQSRNNLGNAYRQAGQTDKAIPLLRQTLVDRERILGSDHPNTLQSRNHLGNAYREARRTDDAIRFLEQALADRERLLGEDHPDTIQSRSNLANTYLQAGLVGSAFAMLKQASSDSRRVLGPDHPVAQAAQRSLIDAEKAHGRK